jgi:hypothetical protein
LAAQSHEAEPNAVPNTPEADPTTPSPSPVTPTQAAQTITASFADDPELFTGSLYVLHATFPDGSPEIHPDRAKRNVPLPTSIPTFPENFNSVTTPTTSTSSEGVASHHAIFKLVGRQEEGVVCVAAVDGVDTGPVTSSLTILLSQSGTITTIVTAVVVTPPPSNPTAVITTEITLVTSSAGTVETYVATATITPPAPPVSYTPVTIVTVVNGTSSTIVTDARVSTLYPVDLSTTIVYTTTSSGHLATITTIENLADVESITVASAPPVSSTFSVPPLRITLDYPSSTTTTSRSGASLLSPISGRVFFIVFGILSGFVVGFVL